MTKFYMTEKFTKLNCYSNTVQFSSMVVNKWNKTIGAYSIISNSKGDNKRPK